MARQGRPNLTRTSTVGSRHPGSTTTLARGEPMTADVVIRGRHASSTAPAHRRRAADVAITDGVITEIGDRPRRRAASSTPAATSSRRASSTSTRTTTRRCSGTRRSRRRCWHGVTSVVAGQLRLLDRAGATASTASCSCARCSTSRTWRPTRCSRACRGTTSRRSRSTSTRSSGAARCSTTRATSATPRCASS